jgi:hypothetical protein
MQETVFTTWFKEGIGHILTLEALDHILFIAVLCAACTLAEWKKLLILVTAFTLGHSITLVLTAFGYINVNRSWVEFLIPLTIAATAAVQLYRPGPKQGRLPLIYLFALCFGFIHGMAYGAGQIGSLYEGREAIMAVLGFNTGVEVAQLCVVAVFLLLSFIFVKVLSLSHRIWQLLILCPSLAYAVYLAVKNFPS